MNDKKVATTCAVGERDGKVVLQFPEAVQWAAFDLETAKNIGMAMAKQAYDIKYGSGTVNATKQLTEQLENKLKIRLTGVIKNLADRHKSPEFIAREVIAIVLREVY